MVIFREGKKNLNQVFFLLFFTRVVNFFRFLRIIILVRVFRLAAQKKELEKVTRRMVRPAENITRSHDGVFANLIRLFSFRFLRTRGATRRMDLTLIWRTSQVGVTPLGFYWILGAGDWKNQEKLCVYILFIIYLYDYIADRVIAMSFPSSGKQAFYRNPIKVNVTELFKSNWIFMVFQWSF